MMKFYLSGVFIVLLVNIVRTFIHFLQSFSIRVKNLSKVSGKYNFLTGEFSHEEESISMKLFMIADLLIITPLLSWAYLAYFVFAYTKARINKAPIPESVKEIQFRLATIEMDSKGVIDCLRKLGEVMGANTSRLTHRILSDDPDEDADTLILTAQETEDDWQRSVTVNPQDMRYEFYSRTPDYCGEYTDTLEIKVDGMSVLQRVIEDKNEYMGKTEYDVRNSIVMEEDIRQREESAGFSKPEKIQEKIDRLKESATWHELQNPAIKHFILFRCSPQTTDLELSRYFRTELERIRVGREMFLKALANAGGYYDPTAPFVKIQMKEGTPEEDAPRVRSVVDGLDQGKYGISYFEFEEAGFIRCQLELYLQKLA